MQPVTFIHSPISPAALNKFITAFVIAVPVTRNVSQVYGHSRVIS